MAINDHTRTLIFASIVAFVLPLFVGTVPTFVIDFFAKKFPSVPEEDDSEKVRSWWQKVWKWFKREILVQNRIVQFLSQIGGGVILYTAFIHMLPEIRGNYEVYLENKANRTGQPMQDPYSPPLVDLFALAGFFGIFLIEEIMHAIFLGGDNHDHGHGHDAHEEHKPTRTKAHKFLTGLLKPFIVKKKNENLERNNNFQVERSVSVSSGSEFIQPKDELPWYGPTAPIEENGTNKDPENIETLPDDETSTLQRIADAFCLILAFACHTIFDGISIGVQQGAMIWTVLFAIMAHQLPITFSIFIEMYQRCFHVTNPTTAQSVPIRGARFWVTLFAALFACMVPIGIYIDVGIGTSGDEEQTLPIVILSSVSSGSLIFIAFLEVIDKSHSRVYINGLVQWVALLMGFGIMAIIAASVIDV